MATQKTSSTGLVLGFGAAVLQCLPRISDLEMQAFIGNPRRLKEILQGAFKQVVAEHFDEAEYFKNRPGLFVDIDLERYIGFTKKPARSIESLTSYTLEGRIRGTEIFGEPGSTKRAEVMAGVVDLSQIAALIDFQSGGISGSLLNEGGDNLFTVIGKKGELCVVCVEWDAINHEWYVSYHLWDEGDVWGADTQFFSNKN
jgi:hypothetical protein